MLPHDTRDATPRWLLGAITLVCLAIALREATVLLPHWQAWQAGVPDVYPGQHRGAFYSSARGLLLALAIPVPMVAARRAGAGRAARAALWGTWTLAMGGILALYAVEYRTRPPACTAADVRCS